MIFRGLVGVYLFVLMLILVALCSGCARMTPPQRFDLVTRICDADRPEYPQRQCDDVLVELFGPSVLIDPAYRSLPQ